ncbi:MAG: ABC transporter ATP-binding protein [Gammaproteobacteria bacterium]|nr:ABC transporter ATP-binding protein [Gammaproteobacteria bacterium]
MTISSKASTVIFEHVSKVFAGEPAVDNVSFKVEAGKLVTLLGPSGCGKTTTLRMIAGLDMVTSGRIYIGEEDVTSLPATDRDVSMVFQSYALFPHMTVAENVGYGLVVSGMHKTEAQERAEDGLGLVGLSGYGKRLPRQLSGGQQQRVAVARALVLEPQVLLFDEPLSNLDAKLRRQVREEIRDIQQKLGLTVVYVTHDQEEALAVSDRIIVMKNAGIAQEGTPREIYSEPANLFVADFIGDANLVQAEVLALERDWATVKIGSIELRLPSRGVHQGQVQVALRPESLLMSQEKMAGAIEGEVAKVTYLGSHMEYTIDTSIGRLFMIDTDVMNPAKNGALVSIMLRNYGIALVKEG